MPYLATTNLSLPQENLLKPLISRQECGVFGMNIYRTKNREGLLPVSQQKPSKWIDPRFLVRMIR